MDSGRQGVLHGPSLSERIGPRHDSRNFFCCLYCVWGGGGDLSPRPFVSLYSFFIVVSFILNGVLRAGTCPISHFFQLLGVVVRTEKYGQGGAFPWTGPLVQCRHRRGLTGLLPLIIAPQNPVVRLLGRRGGFW